MADTGVGGVKLPEPAGDPVPSTGLPGLGGRRSGGHGGRGGRRECDGAGEAAERDTFHQTAFLLGGNFLVYKLERKAQTEINTFILSDGLYWALSTTSALNGCSAGSGPGRLAAGGRPGPPAAQGRRQRPVTSHREDDAPPPRRRPGSVPALASLVDFVLEYVQVVGGSHGDNVLRRVPGRVQDLLIEVQTVHTNLVLLSLTACTHFPRL